MCYAYFSVALCAIIKTSNLLSQIYGILLGRNSSPNEPWPDVLGVAVVIIITVMFMLGLDVSTYFRRIAHTYIYTYTHFICIYTYYLYIGF